MPRSARLFPGDEELGKRDDDHIPGSKSPLGLAWQHRRPHLRRTSLKRVGLVLAVVVALYYFFSYMPTDLRNPRPRPRYDRSGGRQVKKPPANLGFKGEGKDGEDAVHYFNGPIKFYDLAATLRDVPRARDGDPSNRNVVFAASSLTSASNLLPIACDMGIIHKSVVHFAIMGRDDIPLKMLKDINGITDECNVIFHDARPDYSIHSSDIRMGVSCAAGLNHINSFLHPRAVLIDGSGEENIFFTKGMKGKADSLGRTLIELPEDAQVNIMWISQLDSSALEAWTHVEMEILVHAPPASSGSLIRLLESLKKADYFSSTPPRLTIELPNVIDEPTRMYLENFRWPPKAEQNTGSLLSLHHRIPQHTLTPVENSIRFLETFWTSRPYASHVLVLSPQVELSPLFFHYLKYTVLEYKYSFTRTDMSANLMGISLELPTRQLSDSEEFNAPANKENSPFFWQAPNSNAALYFGERWLELQSFVSHSLSQPGSKATKLVSKDHPSWLEYVLQLARARGYWLLYPNFSESIATLHTETYNPPEEFSEKEDEVELDFTADPSQQVSMKREPPLVSTALLTTLGDLPNAKEIPLLTWDGEKTNFRKMGESAVAYSRVLREQMGCDPEAEQKERKYVDAGDLFCDGDEPPKAVAEDESVKPGAAVDYSGQKVER